MLLLFLFNIFFIYYSKCDVFTAMTELENLLANEAKTSLLIVEKYIKLETQRLNELRQLAISYEKKNNETKNNYLNAAKNPLKAYLLIKRLLKEWNYIEDKMNANSAVEYIKDIKEGRLANAMKFPDEDDVNGAAVGILRLQDTYKLKAKDLINGNIDGEFINTSLTVDDCFEIGRAAYFLNDYYHTLEWMQEAFDKLDPNNSSVAQHVEILEYLAISMYYQGNPKHALFLTMQIAELDPENKKAQDNIKWYNQKLEEKDKTNFDYLPPIVNKQDVSDQSEEKIRYEKLCRGEFNYDLSKNPKIYCYLKQDRPFLKIAPIKVEILHLKPLVVLFRQIISDDEIAVVKNLATPKLRRATVQNSKTGELEFASYRISKSAWLKDNDHEVIHRINNRIDLMTNLNQETSEDFQVANYGIGGHYEPHYDMSLRGEENPYSMLTGNRIATVLFYISDIKKGGATVFTELKISVSPSHHDALFWYNLKRSGEGDLRTRHAACPVLLGNKWVSNKWIHERGQEFRRPCGLKFNVEENFVGDLSF